jgi:hypothetical protein
LVFNACSQALIVDFAFQQGLQISEKAVSNLKNALFRFGQQIPALRVLHEQLNEHIPDFGIFEIFWLPIIGNKLQIAWKVKS